MGRELGESDDEQEDSEEESDCRDDTEEDFDHEQEESEEEDQQKLLLAKRDLEVEELKGKLKITKVNTKVFKVMD